MDRLFPIGKNKILSRRKLITDSVSKHTARPSTRSVKSDETSNYRPDLFNKVISSFGTRSKRLLTVLFLFAGSLWPSSDLQISPELQNITDFRTDRLAFHFVQLVDKEGKTLSETNPNRDSSEATLMIIYKGQLTLLKDGYDDPNRIREKEKEYLVKISNYARLRELESEYYRLPESERSVTPGKSSETSGSGATSVGAATNVGSSAAPVKLRVRTQHPRRTRLLKSRHLTRVRRIKRPPNP